MFAGLAGRGKSEKKLESYFFEGFSASFSLVSNCFLRINERYQLDVFNSSSNPRIQIQVHYETRQVSAFLSQISGNE